MSSLPGRPDVVFPRQRLVVFCDGDFWHGRDWNNRLEKLKRGHNSAYWLAKIQANRDRDRRRGEQLQATGWVVLRLWETDILGDPQRSARIVRRILEKLDSETQKETSQRG